MKVSALLVGGVIAGMTLAAAAVAQPQGMAPYPGQAAYTPPPAPPVPATGAPTAAAPYPGAPAAAPTERRRPSCIWTRRINGWSPVDNRSMVVTQGTRKFLVTFSGNCPQNRHETAIRIVRPHGSCLGAGDMVDFTNPFGYQSGAIMYAPCMIQKVEIYPGPQAVR
jgi:hypothetical protein